MLRSQYRKARVKKEKLFSISLSLSTSHSERSALNVLLSVRARSDIKASRRHKGEANLNSNKPADFLRLDAVIAFSGPPLFHRACHYIFHRAQFKMCLFSSGKCNHQSQRVLRCRGDFFTAYEEKRNICVFTVQFVKF